MEAETQAPLNDTVTHRGIIRRLLRPTLPKVLVAAIVVALALTVISTMLYVVTGTITTDLSRPGYERIRQEVRASNEDNAIYDTTSPVTAKSIDDFLGQFTKKTQALNNYNDFTNNALDDSELQLAPNGSTITGE